MKLLCLIYTHFKNINAFSSYQLTLKNLQMTLSMRNLRLNLEDLLVMFNLYKPKAEEAQITLFV